jgi:hypothetical protein
MVLAFFEIPFIGIVNGTTPALCQVELRGDYEDFDRGSEDLPACEARRLSVFVMDWRSRVISLLARGVAEVKLD